MRHRRTVLAVNLILVLVVATIGLLAYRAVAAKPGQTDESLRTATVSLGTVTESVSASGTVVSPSTAGADFSTSGVVTAIRVHLGQVVRKGQTLARIDSSTAGLQLTSAQAGLTAAEESRSEVESSAGATSTQIAQADASVKSAQLAVQQAQDQMDATTLTAPIAGTVVSISGRVGQAAAGTGSSSSTSTATGFVVISDLAHLEVTAFFSETDTAKLKPGQAATVTLDALPQTPIAGKVHAIDILSTTVNNVVDYGVTIRLDQRPDALRIGQTTSVSIVTDQAQNALYVPTAAVQTAGGTATVVLLENGGQVTTPVQVGLEGDLTTQIVSGVRQGQRVVIPVTTGANGFPGGGFPGGGLFGGGGGARGGAGGGTP